MTINSIRRIYNAGTFDEILATFVGDFSVSGPHSLGSKYTDGSYVIKTLNITKIGILKQINFEKRGTDGWILAFLSCRVNDIAYIMNVPNLWLDNFDSRNYTLYGNGYEPDAHQTLNDLPASSIVSITAKPIIK